MTRSAIVTGATGFIGGKLCARLLADGWRVHAIVRIESDTTKLPHEPNFVLHSYDGTVKGLAVIMGLARPDAVFHLASLYLADHYSEQVDALLQSNVVFPTQLFESMAATGVRVLINTGTAWQHYEGESYRPVNLYAATKQALEDILSYYTDARDISAITLKLFDTYGVDDPRRKLIQILGDAARSGETLDISPGEQIIDLSHIDDIVEAFVVAAERLLATCNTLNENYFVSGERFTVRELVDQVRIAANRPLQVNLGGRPYRNREVMQPIVPTSNERLPGWEPRHTLQEALPDLLSE